MKNKVVAIIVTYNRLEKLKKCITHLHQQEAKCDIIIVNNASTDGTNSWLEEMSINSNDIKIITLTKNIGGAGGFYVGVKQAIKEGYEYAWLMDDDCYVRSNTLEKLLEADKILNGQYGWLSSVALWRDDTPCLMNKQKLSENFYDKINYLTNSLILSNQATFVSLFFKIRTAIEVGLPIKEFFIWGDDIEYTRRIAIMYKYHSYVVGDSIINHDMETNNGSRISTDSIERINRYFYAYRNEYYLYSREGIKGRLYFATKCAYNIWRILYEAKNNRCKRIFVLLKGVVSGISFSPRIEYIK